MIIAGMLFSGCFGSAAVEKDARDDVRKYLDAAQKRKNVEHIIHAQVETDVVFTKDVDDDGADDPAIWIHPTNPSKSIVFGSNKKKGIHSYLLNGAEVQFVKYAKINNIDIRQQVNWGDQKIDILAGSNRSSNAVDLFLIDEFGRINTEPDFMIGLGEFEPYGLCLYKSMEGDTYIFVNNKYGDVYQLSMNYTDSLESRIIRRWKLDSQVEGMVVNDQKAILYIGEEEKGIHIYSANPADTNKGRILKGSNENEMMNFDIEGISLIDPHYLIASIQGSFSYALFDLTTDEYLTSFKINKSIVDGVEETDGLDVYSHSLGGQFPNGILVVQDGFNYDGEELKKQNFKLIDLQLIRDIIETAD